MEIKRTDEAITTRDLARRRNLLIAAIASPVVLAALPFLLFLVISLVLAGMPGFAISSVLLGILLSIAGFVIGTGFSVYFLIKRHRYTAELRERIAARGIPPDYVHWFRREMRPAERRALAAMATADPLMEDAYRETLASRLTASRILRSIRSELAAARRRENRLREIPQESARRYLEELERDRKKIEEVQAEAKEMLAEAESRLQMIEAAAARGGNLTDIRIALDKLASRAASLPLALEAARLTESTIAELDDPAYGQQSSSENIQ